MTALLLPNTDLVAVAWLKRNTKLAEANTTIATTIPKDPAALRAGVIETSIVGGSPMLELPVRQPVVQVSCYVAPADGSQKMPWGHASQLAEWVWEQTFDRAHMGATLAMAPAGYTQARVLTVEALSEPRRIPDDPGGLARVDLDLLINWTGV